MSAGSAWGWIPSLGMATEFRFSLELGMGVVHTAHGGVCARARVCVCVLHECAPPPRAPCWCRKEPGIALPGGLDWPKCKSLGSIREMNRRGGGFSKPSLRGWG
jgi:hypothetical protein